MTLREWLFGKRRFIGDPSPYDPTAMYARQPADSICRCGRPVRWILTYVYRPTGLYGWVPIHSDDTSYCGLCYQTREEYTTWLAERDLLPR